MRERCAHAWGGFCACGREVLRDMQHTKCIVASVLAIAGAASAAYAGEAPSWDIVINWGSTGSWSVAANPGSYTITEEPGANGAIAYRVVGSHATSNWSAQWDMFLDPDPFVSSNFSIVNNSGVLQTFTVTTITPTIALSGPTTMTGSVSGFVGDSNFTPDQFGNGATVQTQGGLPYYEALVDGVDTRSLYSSPQVNSAPFNLTNGIPAQNFINEAGPALISSIGIRNHFQLTPGDNAGFTSTFLIVPAPASLGLLGVFGLAATRRRR